MKSYFKNHYKDDQLAVNFLPKPDTGAQVIPFYFLHHSSHNAFQGGFICQVANDEFFVKNHTFMGRSSNHSRVDLRELFMYRVLHLMGAGAEPHFIGSAYSDVYVSKLVLHIATKRGNFISLFYSDTLCYFSSWIPTAGQPFDLQFLGQPPNAAEYHQGNILFGRSKLWEFWP